MALGNGHKPGPSVTLIRVMLLTSFRAYPLSTPGDWLPEAVSKQAHAPEHTFVGFVLILYYKVSDSKPFQLVTFAFLLFTKVYRKNADLSNKVPSMVPPNGLFAPWTPFRPAHLRVVRNGSTHQCFCLRTATSQGW